jgi:hypothetical protein
VLSEATSVAAKKAKRGKAKVKHMRRSKHSLIPVRSGPGAAQALQLQQAYSIEELLTRSIIDENAERKTNPILPAVLYSLNAATRKLAYKQGYKLGYKISATMRTNNINTLLTVLRTQVLEMCSIIHSGTLPRLPRLSKVE